MSEDHDDCCFDGWAKAGAKRARRKGTAAAVTASLLAALEHAGLRGRSLLDVGCGTGDLALGAIERGAERATGVDLGAGAIESARSLARERDVSDRATFEVGDGSILDLPHADVVVLNRVLCCFPDASALLANTLPAAGQVFALTAPVDHGAIGAYNRVMARLGNVWYAARDAKYRGFRVTIHDLTDADARIRGAGFRPSARERHRVVWDLRVYERSEPVRASS
ncbi:MAG: methyltransferase domain-containing protein [Actinomycetota bacterium]